jgi:hypothetical protein
VIGEKSMGRLLQMHNSIDWVPIDSSVLRSAAYVAQRRWLYLEFRSGEIYRYFDFPPQQYRDLLAAESKGTYFGKYIRNCFRYEHLPRSRRAGG